MEYGMTGRQHVSRLNDEPAGGVNLLQSDITPDSIGDESPYAGQTFPSTPPPSGKGIL